MHRSAVGKLIQDRFALLCVVQTSNAETWPLEAIGLSSCPALAAGQNPGRKLESPRSCQRQPKGDYKLLTVAKRAVDSDVI